MLRSMRDSTGGPSVAVRLVALLLAFALLVGSAPVILPLARWVWAALT